VDLITSITTNPHAVMLLVILFLLIIGCALDTLGMIFIFVPVLFPLTEAVGIDPLHFAPVFVLCLGIALLTPPVGIILFMVTNISKAPLTEVIRETLPFFLVQIVVLALVAYLPFLSTWLPGLL
jgi:TRAP-type C4-dicarboxylate transport system permease large subunit